MSAPLLFNNSLSENKVQFSDVKKQGKLSSCFFLFLFPPPPSSHLLYFLPFPQNEKHQLDDTSAGATILLILVQWRVLIVNFLSNSLT